jgi:hypothetical protein
MRVAGLEWTSDTLRTVLVTARRGALAVDETRTVPLASDDAVDGALAALAAARPTAVVAALPAGRVAHRTLTLPFRSTVQLARTVPLELRGHLPADPGDACIDHTVLERVAGTAGVLAVLARREDVEDVRVRMARAGLVLGDLAVSPLAAWTLVPGDDDAGLLVVDGRDTTIGMRRAGRPRRWHLLAAAPDAPDDLAAEAAATLAAWNATDVAPWVTGPGAGDAHVRALGAALGRPAELVPPHGRLATCDPATLREYGVPLALAQAEAAGAALAPLLASETSRRGGRRRLPALAAAAALLALLDLGLIRVALVRRAEHLERSATATAAAVLPGTAIVAPRAQLEAVAGRGSGASAGTLLGRLREVASQIPAGLRVDVQELRLDDDLLRLDGRAPTYEAVDSLRRALAASPRLRDVGTEDVHATIDGAQIVFRLRGRWIPPGEAAS